MKMGSVYLHSGEVAGLNRLSPKIVHDEIVFPFSLIQVRAEVLSLEFVGGGRE